MDEDVIAAFDGKPHRLHQAATVLGAIAWVMGALAIMRDRGHAEGDEELHELQESLEPRLETLLNDLAMARGAVEGGGEAVEDVVAGTDAEDPVFLSAADVEAIRREEERAHRGQGDSREDRGLGERCISQPVGNAVFLRGYMSIMQAPGYVVINWFTPGDGVYRIVPLDGRAQLGDRIRQWYGDARGRWEGDTLVVETTNFNDGHAGETLPAHGGLFGTGHSHNYAGTGETLRMVERFTRIDEASMEYRLTIDDPSVFVRPWTAVTIKSRDPGTFPEYEYVCHEHNYGMVNALTGARANEAESLAEAERELNIRAPGTQQEWEQLREWEATQGQN